jgi:DNA polymerase I-like protein with 3'-5' exonuclease and polymerase domains
VAIDEGNSTGPMVWVLNKKTLEQLIEAVMVASEVVVDLETTGLDEHAIEGGKSNGGVGARIVLASFTLPIADKDNDDRWNGDVPTTWILPLSHPDSVWRGNWRRVLRKVINSGIEAKRPFSNQNMKFDSRWMKAQCGVDVTDLMMWDTKDAWHLLDENRSTKLKVRAPQDFGIANWGEDFDLSTPGAAETYPLIELGQYAGRDTWWTWRGMVRQRQEMFLDDVDEAPMTSEEVQAAKIGKLATWIAMPTVASLTKVEQRGILLDVEWTENHLKSDMIIATENLDKMAEMYSMDRASASSAPTSHWFKAWTAEAVNRGDMIVTAITPTGIPSWGKDVLSKQTRQGSDVAKLVLEQKQASKRAEFLRSWLAYATEEGVIHASYNSGSVLTGRLSSNSPNMQQVTKSLRPAFIPREGFYLADFDYSQIELRVAAFISRSIPMIEAFRERKDLHRMFAAVINGVPERDVTPFQRQGAKAGNFGLLYEMGVYGFREYAETAYGVDLSMDDAARIHAAFFEMWSGMREWHSGMKSRAHRDGFVTSPLGRVRRLPMIWDQNDRQVGFAERQAINSPVQSMASDLLQMSMASMQGLLPSVLNLAPVAGAFPVGTVHDSIVSELAIDDWKNIAEECAERMTSLDTVLAKFGVNFDVPLIADYSVGTRWSLHDISDPDVPESAVDSIEEPIA